MRKGQQIVYALFGLLLISITYFTERSQSALLLLQFSLLFVAYYWLFKKQDTFEEQNLFRLAIVFRLLLLFAIPNLSEDVYRFIWDGQLWIKGIDAYKFLPTTLMSEMPEAVDPKLFEQLNSPNYFTIYPPLNQLIFIGAAYMKSTYFSILFIRVLIIGAEILSLIGLPKLLRGIPKSNALFILYAFNPLVILEMSGNLHFEAFVVCAIIWSVIYFKKNQWIKSGAMMGLAIGFKILPIILLASFFRKLNLKQYVAFIVTAIVIASLTLLPLLETNIFTGIKESAQLYFQSFEFNASIYYVVRFIGFQVYRYNIIQTAGPYIAVVGISCIIVFNLLMSSKVGIWERMLFSWTLYCLFATTIHPWYIIPLVLFGSMSHYKFPILWSFLIGFTYIGYSASCFQEILWITALEYILVISFAVFEIRNKYIIKNDEQINAN